MEESVTYQKIIKKGRAEEANRILKRQGSRRFGKPGAHFEAAIDAIADLDRLEQLSDRVLEVTGWEELLAQPREMPNFHRTECGSASLISWLSPRLTALIRR